MIGVSFLLLAAACAVARALRAPARPVVAAPAAGSGLAKPAGLRLVLGAAVVVAGLRFPAFGLAAVPVLLLGRRLVAAWRQRRAHGLAVDALPDAVDAIARGVRAGLPLETAITQAARPSPPVLAAELEPLHRSMGRGLPSAGALDRWAGSSTLDGAALVAAALDLATTSGGDVAGALDGVADTLRDRRTARREATALATQARASATLLGVAPVAFGAVAAAIDGRTARFLFATPIGLACLGAGLALDLAGWRWMRRITEVGT